MKDELAWQRLELLRPALPRHVAFQRREYQQELWYLLHDKSNGRFHRLSPSTYQLLNLMDGRRSLSQILAIAAQSTLYETPESVPTRTEFIELLQYLHVADLLVCDMPPNTQELFARQQQQRKNRWRSILFNPLVLKFRLGNPNALLNRLLPLGRLIATPAMGVLWLLVVAYALLQAGIHWTELTQGQAAKILSPSNLFLLWLMYPLLKIVHELGHGLFTKVWGGDVNECGVVFILATPLPYVDATASIGFNSKRKRLMVSAAGMAVELFIAAISLLLWLQIDDGLTRDILYNLILIGGVSTLFFNGNPLARFDGYYLLTDLCDLPNLAARSNQQVIYWVRRYAYNIQGLHSPAATRQQAIFFGFYAVAAFVYRIVMLLVILLVLIKYFPTLGLLLACWLLFFQIALPMLKHPLSLIQNVQLQANRRRVIAVSATVFGVLLLLITAVPLPMTTRVEGVLWLPDDARIKTDAGGEVIKVLVDNNSAVTQGQPLLYLHNPELKTQLAIKQSMLQEYEARYQEAWSNNRAQAQRFAQDIESIKVEIAVLESRVKSLVVLSPSVGVFKQLLPHELLGSYFAQGATIGVIVKPNAMRIRCVLNQDQIGLVREATKAISVNLSSVRGHKFDAIISQQVPGATYELPSAALGTLGGGLIEIDSTNKEGVKAAQHVFVVDLQIQSEESQSSRYYGERAYVSFSHPSQPIAMQVYRQLQQLFIRNLQ